MRDDPFVVVALSGMLLCLLVLIGQRMPEPGARAEPAPGAPEIGRYRLVTDRSGAVAVHDTRSDQLFAIREYRSPRPVLVPEEMMATWFPVLQIEGRYAPPFDLLKQLRDTAMYSMSANLRAWAADQLGLGDYDPEEVVDALVHALQDEDDEVSVLAALALTRKPHPDALPALRAALSHPNPRVVEYAKQAIAEIEP